MGFFSLLLRLFLCATLIANGIGFAQASARMQLAHASHGSHATLPVGDGGADGQECHPGMIPASHEANVAAGNGALPGALATHADAQHAEPMDCCDGMNCQCACAQHVSTGFMADVMASVVPVHPSVAMAGASQHASPRLPHLIRPPIG